MLKLTRQEITNAEKKGFRDWEKGIIEGWDDDAENDAICHAQITKVLWEIGRAMTTRRGHPSAGEFVYERYISEEDWQALLAEAGVKEAKE